jgi:signal transduction histidine kinase/DNA-binding NarL/FixJ family response regulator
MKTLLVLAQHPDLPQAIESLLSPESYRILHRLNVEEAEPLLAHRAAHACIIDAETGSVQGLWGIEKLRRRFPQCPLIVFTASKGWDFEEEAYVQGVSYVLAKPVRGRILNALLERIFAAAPQAQATAPLTLPFAAPGESSRETQGRPDSSNSLASLRDFSSLLAQSLRADGLLREFLLRLREVIGVNRASIFLRRPLAAAGSEPTAPDAGKTLHLACSIGLPSGLLETLDLSLDSGIGSYLDRSGRVLRRNSVQALADPAVQREFELLGADVAIPILDREALVGLAALDVRITGESLSNPELELLFHLLEELGLAVKNIWVHDQLAANHEIMGDILRELSSACVVIAADLTILHSNKAARHHFSRPGRRAAELEFSDLPMLLGSKVYQVLKTGTAIETFKYQPPDSPRSVFYVSLVPFQRRESGLPNSVLLIVEDRTQAEQLQRLELEASTLRLIRSMADRMAHEIGNALVPLSTHQQLLGEKFKDPEFRASLDTALAEGVKRIARLTSQMRFLARDNVASRELLSLKQLLEEAYSDAKKHFPARASKLRWDVADQPLTLSGDHAALRHAFSEVLLNALQANPTDAQVEISAKQESDPSGTRWVHIDVQDHGSGFPPETLSRLPEPFFTTRNVGLGLGLSVSRKIIENHQGRLSLRTSEPNHSGIVRISLPLDTSSLPKN